jgi:hypothetical protein
MNNTTLQVKFKKRLNKIDSQDYDNIQSWEIAEAYNKAQIEWCRRQLSGTNMRQEGDEMSKRRIDDLSILLKRETLIGVDVIYDDKFGYFESTNFGNIYNPNIGGDYLEFKRIECNSQQCFPFIPASDITQLVDVTNTVPGYWQDGGWTVTGGYYNPGAEAEVTTVRRVPTFTFYSHGQSQFNIPKSPWDQNTITSWGSLGAVLDYANDVSGGIFPGIQPSEVVTQEPWVWNQTLEFAYVMQGISPYSTTPPGNYDIVYNQNIIPPWGGNSDSNNDGITDACDLCNKTAFEITNDTDLLTLACSGNNTGWLVGGPSREWINCNGGGPGIATYETIPDLYGEDYDGILYDEDGNTVLPYNYTNTPNTWANNSQAVFAQVEPGEYCGIACWWKPGRVDNIGYSLNDWQTTPGEWVPYTFTENEDVYIDPVTTTYQVEETTTIPFQNCYCAPGADKDNFCVKPRSMTVYQSEVANVDVILRDPLKRPDFEWSETFCTFQSNNVTPQIRIWRKDFYIMDPVLVYYRVPRRIEILGSVDPYTGIAVAADVNPEFKDDIVELIIDSAVAIIAGDISDVNQMGRGSQESEKNN